MTANTVNGGGNRARSGAQILVLLAAPLNVRILRSLADGPKQQAELGRECGLPAQTTLRAQLKRLTEIGAIEKHRRNRFPGALEYELTAAGRELVLVAQTLEDWLEMSPNGPLPLEDNAAKAAVKALAEGWSTTMLRALAASPLSLTELDRVIASHNYPSLERRLGAMRLTGLVDTRPSTGRGTPYTVTDWLRQGVAPLAMAARWERRHIPAQTASISALDIEAAFLLTVPMLRLPAKISGSCRMAVEAPNGKKRHLAGVVLDLKRGNVRSCKTNLAGTPRAWAIGPVAAWLSAVIEADFDRLELGGDCGLARSLLSALHESLFTVPMESQFENSLDLSNLIRNDLSN